MTRYRDGKREGAGRKPGTPNKTTQEQREAVAASGMTPLEYMLDVMRNVAADEGKRLDAAKAAAPYVHARLSAVELTGAEGGPISQSILVEFVGTTSAAE